MHTDILRNQPLRIPENWHDALKGSQEKINTLVQDTQFHVMLSVLFLLSFGSTLFQSFWVFSSNVPYIPVSTIFILISYTILIFKYTYTT